MIDDKNPDAKSVAVGAEDFHPIIIRRNDGFCVYLPEWRLSGEGSSLEEAYRQFEIDKKAFEARDLKYGLSAVTPEPYPTFKKKALLQELSLSFAKAATGMGAAILVAILLLPNIGAAFRNQAKAFLPAEMREPTFWIIQFPAKVNAQLDRLQPAEADQMQREWGRLIERTRFVWKPLAGAPDKATNPPRSK